MQQLLCIQEVWHIIACIMYHVCLITMECKREDHARWKMLPHILSKCNSHISAEGTLKVCPGHKLGLEKQWTAHVREEEFLQQCHFNIC